MTDRSCPVCGGSLDGLRRDATYCCAGCRYRAWTERHPARARQRLATPRARDSGRSTRTSRKGAHGERGARIYFTPADLAELRTLTADASPRLARKVSDATARIERG